MIREMGFKKADDFYIALGQAKVSAKVATNKIMQRLKQGESAVEPQGAAAELLERRERRRRPRPRRPTASGSRGSTT